MDKRKRRLTIISIISALAGILLIVFGAMCQKDVFWGPLLSGAGASIIASLLFWFLTDLLTSNPEVDRLSNIAERFEYMEQTKTDGLVEIRKRKDADMKFWVDFVEEATTELTLSGRTLCRWLDESRQEGALKDAVLRIARLKGHTNVYSEPVRLVIYSDTGIRKEVDRIATAASKDRLQQDLINEKLLFKKFIHGIWTSLNDSEKARIAVYEIEVLPYMYCSNGKVCVTGAYFDNKTDKMNMQLVLKCGSGAYERDYAEDFNAMLQRTTIVSDISSFII